MPRRSALKKADDKVGDEQMTDEKLEQLQDTSVKDVDESNKSEGEDEDEDDKDKFAKKGEEKIVIPKEKLIAASLQYARELEQIV